MLSTHEFNILRFIILSSIYFPSHSMWLSLITWVLSNLLLVVVMHHSRCLLLVLTLLVSSLDLLLEIIPQRWTFLNYWIYYLLQLLNSLFPFAERLKAPIHFSTCSFECMTLTSSSVYYKSDVLLLRGYIISLEFWVPSFIWKMLNFCIFFYQILKSLSKTLNKTLNEPQ